ncbi:glycoside hydrolase family 2 protein [Plantibacter sp. MMLR14_011]|uniref:glycoside hydrolase family 2 protein n=1 Tax=Plantibacter sp. MMLR14_011 TaxID=1898746 RepID=UPI0008DDC635|nr:sugar-binding domain-containing protein [Plantibacter sp. MMLR14_011]OII39254.1 glycoside hydrolase [Plantibacter sp. MMLR14_011]
MTVTATQQQINASEQDGTYPRPQLLRSNWVSLDGTWEFSHDDANIGLDAGWRNGFESLCPIEVPYPPESAASGIGDTRFHPIVWYQRHITTEQFQDAGFGTHNSRLLLHFGAVDYRASIWVDGNLVGQHEGGHTPFAFDITSALSGDSPHLLVVRAEDDPHDVTQPRGKQDWHEDSHVIWYRRTTGIWQPVWLEAVPPTRIANLHWAPGAFGMQLTVRLAGTPADTATVRVTSRYSPRDEVLGTVKCSVPRNQTVVEASVPIARQRNGQAADELMWAPDHPRLIDARIELLDEHGAVLDTVESYYGLRTVGVRHGRFTLNGRPYDVRSVLSQGFWPESHLAAPNALALRREAELIKELGFNACRVHQKIEDPRFLFWADKLGLLVWGEMPGAYEFSANAVQRLTAEWMAAVDRDLSHPSIVTWVPFNESWGVQNVADDPSEQAFVRALTDLTRALDPSRPVVANDGWEQQNTDILTVHDYEGDGRVLQQTYADESARRRLVEGFAPSGRAQLVGGASDSGQPVMLTEFGGIDYQPDTRRADGWGYTSASDADDFLERLGALYDGVRSSSFLAGSCYTQLTDTDQETNGLLRADRTPKVPVDRIRSMICGGQSSALSTPSQSSALSTEDVADH